MPSVDGEIKAQGRVIDWLVDNLRYIYMGNLKEQDNTPIKPRYLRKNLEKRGYTKEQIGNAISKLTRAASNQVDSLYQVNKDVYHLLRYGVDVKGENNTRPTLWYIDWDNPDNNDFYVAEEVTVLRSDGESHKRPDLVIYINGIALGMFELKRSSISAGEGIRQLLQNQKDENIKSFFATEQLLFAGNESEGLYYGTIKTPQKFYVQWKEDKNAKDDLSAAIAAMQAEQTNRLRDGVISLCQKDRFLSLVHDFIIFDAGKKKVARHNQYFANIAARKRILDGEGGIIWNTQGSGKSLIMAWLAQWIVEAPLIPNGRVVVITDRDELDDQIESLFYDVDMSIRRAKRGKDLRNVLNTDQDAIVCSLIHKYGHNAGKDLDIEKYRKELIAGLESDYSPKGNIVAFIDECHRTNSGKLHAAVRTLMPEATLIGFTGTPLLKTDKQTTLETFGTYIHTYKFDEGVEDGVILDLRYEARDVDQDLTSKEKVDLWFEEKTRGLTENAKQQLKQSWATLNRVYSSRGRLEKIASDIIFDMNMRPRLKDDRGTAMLVANSIFEACKYWEIFNSMGFTKCAVVTSYEPTAQSVRTATIDLTTESEEEYKKSIYERMIGDMKVTEFEDVAKKRFKEEPADMKLLIVVDKLLTGFDAPSATYLYIDKSMRDHDLFQAICRVNRPDGEDKDYGYIVDYKDLFRNVQVAINDYTSDAFSGYDKEDIEGLVKNRYDEAKAEMEAALASLDSLFQQVPNKNDDSSCIQFFCGDDYVESEERERRAKRDTLYALVASLSRSFAACCDRLVSDYGYTETDVEDVRTKVSNYSKIKDMIRLASCDYIDLKPYEADMRYILDTYIRAKESTTISKLGDMSIVELLLNSPTTSPSEIFDGLTGSHNAKAEIIENNLQFEIVRRIDSNPVYYGKLSEKLQQIILQRRIEAMAYEEYLRQVEELARSIVNPYDEDEYPEGINGNQPAMVFYDYFEGVGKAALALSVDKAVRDAIRPSWKSNQQVQQLIKQAIYKALLADGWSDDAAVADVEHLFEFVVQKQPDYDI